MIGLTTWGQHRGARSQAVFTRKLKVISVEVFQTCFAKWKCLQSHGEYFEGEPRLRIPLIVNTVFGYVLLLFCTGLAVVCWENAQLCHWLTVLSSDILWEVWQHRTHTTTPASQTWNKGLSTMPYRKHNWKKSFARCQRNKDGNICLITSFHEYITRKYRLVTKSRFPWACY